MAATAIYQLLHNALEAVRGWSNTISQYARSQDVPRVWMYPTANWSGNPFDIKDMAEPFQRREPATAYEHGILVPHKDPLNVVMAHKLEMDYLSVMERSFRLRHMSPVRAIALTAGRRLAHGDENGVHTVIRTYIQDRLAGN